MKKLKKLHFKSMRGITLIGLLLIAIVVIFVAIIGMSLVSPYIENMEVKNSLELLAKEDNIKQVTNGKIKELFTRRMQVNSISHITSDNLIIEKKEGKTWLIVNYETRVHVIGNIDAVIKFNNQAMLE